MFNIGDKIVHPLHGAGIISGIEERKICGEVQSYYILKLPVGGMVVMIPVNSCEMIGVRPVVAPEKVDSIFRQLKDIHSDMTQNWNRRYRENMVKIKSGNLLEVASVIKGLLERDIEKGLSTGERKMLRSAKQIFISEIVLAENSCYEDVECRLDAALCEAMA